MRLVQHLLVVFFISSSALASAQPANWTTPLAPFQIADNLFYVGSRDLAAYLVTTPAGNILINANLASSPPQIRSSIEKLGFRWADTKIVFNSQDHFDHVGGLAQILRETHALDEVMEGDAEVVRTGGRSDFATGTDGIRTFAPARVDRVLHDGDTVQLGDPEHGGVTLTAHKTAGYTRGCTTWTLRAHIPGEAAGQLRNIVIVGGFTALSQYDLAGPRTAQHPATYPGIANDFRHTFATLRALPCDVFLGAHGVYFNLLQKLPRASAIGPSVWIDPQGYQAAINDAESAFNADLKRQL